MTALALLVPVAARAADTGSVLRIRVSQPMSPAAGVSSIGLQAEQESNRYWSGTVTGTGTATFRGVPAGRYHVTVAFSGTTPIAADIDVRTGEILFLQATMTLAAAGASRLEVVERRRDGEGTDFHAEQLRSLPSSGDLWALIDTAAPFLIADRIDNGGLGTGRSALIGNRGASFNTTSIAFGDVDVWNPTALGILPMLASLSGVEMVGLTTGTAPVEVAASGTSIVLVPRRPPHEPQGQFDLGFTAGPMASTNATAGKPSIGRLDDWTGLGFQFGTRLRERVGLFVSDDFASADIRDRTDTRLPKSQSQALFATVVARPNDRDEIRLIAAIQGSARPYDGRLQFANRGSTERDTFFQSQATWDRLGGSGGRRQLSFGVQHGNLTPKIATANGGTMDRIFDGPVPLAPSAATVTRWEGRAELQPHDVRARGMDHSLRVGVTAGESISTGHVLTAPTVAEMVDGIPARVWLDSMPAAGSRRRVLGVQFYGADEIAVGSRLGIMAGIRGDISTGRARGGSGTTWYTFAPRLSFRWHPGWLTVFGGYGRYHPRLTTDLLAFGDPGESGALVYRWNDLNQNQQFDPGELGVLVAQAGRGQPVASIASNLRAPRTDEWTLGITRQFGESHVFRGALVFRREHDILGSVNTGVTAADYRTLTVPDQGEDYSSPSDDRLLTIYDRLPASFGHDRFVLSNPAGASALYEGAEVSSTYTSASWYSSFGAMAYRTKAMGGNRGFGSLENDQGVVGERYENPNAASYSVGSIFFDRSYVAKWSTTYHGAHDVRVGVTVRYQDGQPFSRVVVATNLAQGPEAIPAYRTGRTRFTFTSTIDVRVEKGLKVAGHDAAVRLDIFNLANQALEVEENPVTGALFRQTTAVQPPRTIRLGVSVRF